MPEESKINLAGFKKPLKGDKVLLEPLSFEHCSDRYASWFLDAEVCRENRHGSGHYTVEDTRDYVRSIQHSEKDLVFAVRLLSTGEHVGNISINDISWANRFAEISILLGEKTVWGKGIGTEACRLAISHAFGALKLHRLWMGMTAGNLRMITVAKKLGFIFEGRFKDAFFKDGAFKDVLQWGLINPREVQAAKASSIVVLMKYGNALGLEYLKSFLAKGFPVKALIFEGDSYDPKDRQILFERVEGKYRAPFLGEVLKAYAGQLYFVPKHNSEECENLLRSLEPRLVVLGGVGIIGKPLLSIARDGVINCHPGLIPEYRGCCCVEWSMLR